MELLLATIITYAPGVYFFGVAGTTFRIFVSRYEATYNHSFIELLGMLVYSLFVGSIWPGLLLSKIAI